MPNIDFRDPTWKIASALSGNLSAFLSDLMIIRYLNQLLPSSIDPALGPMKRGVEMKIRRLSAKEKAIAKRWAAEEDVQERVAELDDIAKTVTRIAMLTHRIPKFVREMSLVYLVASFEDSLASDLGIVFAQRPECMKSASKTLTYEDVFGADNLDVIKEKTVEKEVAEIMGNNIDLIGTRLSERFNIDLRKTPRWDAFAECFYRRNILIHNAGYVNEKYRSMTKYKGKSRRLDVTKDYLEGATGIFEEYANLVWKKFHHKFCRNQPEITVELLLGVSHEKFIKLLDDPSLVYKIGAKDAPGLSAYHTTSSHP